LVGNSAFAAPTTARAKTLASIRTRERVTTRFERWDIGNLISADDLKRPRYLPTCLESAEAAG
jgi:hypothetical protein